jgi:hypothetical protein
MEPSEVGKIDRPHDRPRYRVSFETAADSPEELQRRIAKGLGREVKRAKRKVSTRKLR